jgi:hypothetical protein
VKLNGRSMASRFVLRPLLRFLREPQERALALPRLDGQFC